MSTTSSAAPKSPLKSPLRPRFVWITERLAAVGVFLAAGILLIVILGLAQRLGWISAPEKLLHRECIRNGGGSADFHLSDASEHSSARPRAVPNLRHGTGAGGQRRGGP